MQGLVGRVHAEDGRELPGAATFGGALQRCPLRYVLSDELVRCATSLAFAEGDRLSGCLDLIYVPAQSVWIEWSEVPRREVLKSISSLGIQVGAPARHAGALVTAGPNCRAGEIRTFWSTPTEKAYLSPIVTRFDFDRTPPATRHEPGSWCGDTALTMAEEPAIEELLTRLRFRFDDEWATYYRARCNSDAMRQAVLRSSLGGCAFDAPMLMAFFLLLGARNLLPRREVLHERLNRARARAGRSPLLEHVELSAPLDEPKSRERSSTNEAARQSPRLHHVRGHIARRGSRVFWRSPHMRGSARFGQVRSRTVTLTGAPPNAAFSGRFDQSSRNYSGARDSTPITAVAERHNT